MAESASAEWQRRGDDFHAQVGYCIAEWSRVDNELFAIFRRCVGGPLLQCAIIYYRVPGLEARFGLTDELVKSLLPETIPGGAVDPKLKAWKEAISRHGDLLGVRRRIAHQPIDLMIDLVPGRGMNAQLGTTTLNEAAPPHEASWFEVYVNQHEGMRTKEAQSKPLRIDDLKAHLDEVVHLHDRLHGFFDHHLMNIPPPTSGS